MKKEKISPFTNLGASNHSEKERQTDDFYSSPAVAINELNKKLIKYNINLSSTIVEPGVGSGGIVKPLKQIYPYKNYICFDIVDRGYPNTIVQDFLGVTREQINNDNISIIANIPYKDVLSQTIHSLNLLKNGEYLIHLAKIQYLEGKMRFKLFEEQPPKYVFVFVNRIKCLNNDKDDGASSAMCFCWFIFEKGFKGNPLIDWI